MTQIYSRVRPSTPHFPINAWSCSNRPVKLARSRSLIERHSRYGFAETVDLLSRTVVETGSTIFTTIDQRAAAKDVGLDLRPTTLIIFGNPKGGTGLMNSHPLVALELPLKILIWEERAVIKVAYVPASEFAARYDVADALQQIEAMDRLLERVSMAVA
jgi:uncharacterized protein (DUF302 family)